MNALEQFYIELDQNNWDVKQESDINQALQKVNTTLLDQGLLDIHHYAEVDRQAFHFSKTPETKLSYRAAGIRKMEDGTENPFEWPDIRDFNTHDFEYLYNRFKSSKNIYAKTEYGLVLFYSKAKQNNDFILELLQALFDLLKIYVEKAILNDDKNHYIIYSRVVLSNALYIANKRKESKDVEAIFKSLVQFTFDVHQNWDVSKRSSLRTIIDLTDFAIQYYKDFKQNVDVSKFIEKNWESAKFLSETYPWGAIYVADISIKLSRKLGNDLKDWLYFKAAQYEKLSLESKDNQNLAAVTFIEKAMTIFKRLKDQTNLDRLQEKYQQLRTEFKLGEVSQELPQGETQRIMELIKREIQEKSEEEIIKTLLLTPMISPLDNIKKWSESSLKDNMLQNMLPVSIKDKFGNTVAQYITEEERNKFSLLRTYEFHMQIAMQTIIQYVVQAFRAGKLTANGILSLLKQAWMGEVGIRKNNLGDTNFSYIKMVEPGINIFFEELSKWKEDPNYYPNFVSATDSLVLKAEYFLREICYFSGIATFKQNPKQEGIIMEKTLDNMLDDLKGKLSDNDHFFIKFVMTEKAGYNLRNQVAHGLMDNVDYGLEYPVLGILIILKLSNYQFTPILKD